VPEVLGARPRDLGAEQPTGMPVGVDSRDPSVLVDDATPTLLVEQNFARYHAGTAFGHAREGLASHRDLRVGEDDLKAGAPRARSYVGVSGSVRPREDTLVGLLVKGRPLWANTARQEHVAAPHAHRCCVSEDETAFLDTNSSALQVHIGEIRPSAHGYEGVVEGLDPRMPARIFRLHEDALPRQAYASDVRVELDGYVGCENASSHLADPRIGQGSQSPAATEHAHANSEAAERLPKFEADDAGSKDRHRVRQVSPRENIVVNDDALPRIVQRGRDDRLRTGRHDDGARAHEVAFHIEDTRRDESHGPYQLLRGRDRIVAERNRLREAIELLAHPVHHGATVDCHGGLEPKRSGRSRIVRRVRRCNKKLARQRPVGRTRRRPDK
jgi:hypothetical protein